MLAPTTSWSHVACTDVYEEKGLRAILFWRPCSVSIQTIRNLLLSETQCHCSHGLQADFLARDLGRV